MSVAAQAPRQTESDILYKVEDRVATVTFNRPEAYNAYTTETLVRLHEALRRAMWDDEVGVVVLTGAGRAAFCTGGDVKEYAERYIEHPEQFRKYMVLFQDCLDAIRAMGKPTIARLIGMAVGVERLDDGETALHRGQRRPLRRFPIGQRPADLLAELVAPRLRGAGIARRNRPVERHHAAGVCRQPPPTRRVRHHRDAAIWGRAVEPGRAQPGEPL